MLELMLLFIIVALIAGYFGFFALSGTAAMVAQILFFVAIALIILRGVGDAIRGRPPV